MTAYPLALSTWGPQEYAAIQRVVDSDMFSMGPEVRAYESEFAAMTGSRHAVMTSSGSTANLLMVAALFCTTAPRLQRGDEVIVPAVSWSTTYFPLQQYGLHVTFVDIDPETLNIDLTKLAAAVSDRTRAILLVNLLGNPNDYTEVQRIVGERDIVVLEDNCESMGAELDGTTAGTFGQMGTFSSFFSHHISTMEGGGVVTDDEELHHVLLALRAHGWTRNLPEHNHVTGTKSSDPFEESFRFVLPGYNVRPLEMSGAIGREQLRKLPGFVARRRANAETFLRLFGDDPHLAHQREVGASSWFGFALGVRDSAPYDRRALVAALQQAEVECRPVVSGNFLKNTRVLSFFDYSVAGAVEAADALDTSWLFVGNHHVPLEAELEHLRRVVDTLA